MKSEVTDKKKRRATVDKRNKLNDLSSKEWVKKTKSVWYSKPPPRDRLKVQHPATFAESDIEELILFFTKKGERVLDPFVGVGSTLLACYNTERTGVGIELINKWANIARERLNRHASNAKLDQLFVDRTNQTVVQGDSRLKIREFKGSEFDFIVTSPPYWQILRKAADHKTKRERLGKNLPTVYSEEKADLGNIINYKEFLNQLEIIFSECYRVLKKGKYMCVIVSDFRREKKFIMYHSDLVNKICEIGFILKSVNILIQDNKKLYPYGYPFDYVPNVNHQYILIFRKPHSNTN